MSNTLNIKIVPNQDFVVKVNSDGGRIRAVDPITVKDQIRDRNRVEDLLDVTVVNRTNGSTLIFNSNTNLYELKPFNFSGNTLIDELQTNLLQVGAISANGSIGSAGDILFSDGSKVYWFSSNDLTIDDGFY